MNDFKKPPTTDGRCGTYAGVNAHRKRGEYACDQCCVARAAYMREFRARRPDNYADEKRRNRARDRANWRLVELHRDEWQQLYHEELDTA